MTDPDQRAADPGAAHARLAELLDRAARWRAQDPDPSTVAELDEILARADLAELEELFGAALQFGTAGIRGPLGPGPNRMNRLVVHRTVAGIARVLRRDVHDAVTRGVVVGRDARHGSAAFADEAVEVLRSAGIAVHAFDEPVPTPLAVAAVTELRAAAGLVVTASHNPPTDNGLKVVGEDGAQIIPPWDTRILEATGQGETPTGPRAPLDHLGGSTGSHPVVLAYLERARRLAGESGAGLRVAVTALHGVGGDLLLRALAQSGCTDVHPVIAQQLPDPDFPTVASPNPERPESLAELLALAASVDADVAVALDPDGDRLAAAVPGDDGWRVLDGDEVGALLLHHLLERSEGIGARLAATTVVSSQLAAAICAARGVELHETLTGFKWLCRPGLAHQDHHQVLIYEEAMGYGVGPDARDKDGITAALVLLDLVGTLRRRGERVGDLLDRLALDHGAHVRANGALPLGRVGRDAAATIGAIAARRELAGVEVRSSDRPAEDVVRLFLADRTRVVLRPSGTEPVVKYYCEAVEQVAAEDTVTGHRRAVRHARQVAQARADAAVGAVRALLVR